MKRCEKFSQQTAKRGSSYRVSQSKSLIRLAAIICVLAFFIGLMAGIGPIGSIDNNVAYAAGTEISITFDANGGAGGGVVQYDYIDTFDSETVPAVTNGTYVFTGWYTEAACENWVDLSKPVGTYFPSPASAGTLYAGWAQEVEVNDEASLRSAVANAPNNQARIIKLTADISLTTGASAATAPLMIPNSKIIILDGGKILTQTQNFYTISINNTTGKLTLKNITVTHASGIIGSGVYVNGANAKLTMHTGAVITGNTAASTGGGVYSNGGTLIMHGGEISGNAVGGGVWNAGTGTFIMHGGEISGNTCDFGGGVRNFGTFTLYGGEISGNTASSGGGVHNSTTGTFTMEGGKVSGNTATGSSNGGVGNTGIFTMNGGEISGNTANAGGGVYHSTAFTMYGGKISDNTALVNGGGVQNYNGTFIMYGGEISDNTAAGGGGGIFGRGTFIIYNGIISGNSADSGGGVKIEVSTSIFTMEDGEISGNFAQRAGGGILSAAITTMKGGAIINNESAKNGGGVFSYSNGTFKIEDGTISGNTAHLSGGGVFVIGNANFTVESGEISGNTAGMHGGGIYHTSAFPLNIPNAVSITDNAATNGYGGGIYITYARLPNLTVEAGATFSGNSAKFKLMRFADDDTMYYANIFPTSWSLTETGYDQGYNNYDIAYTRNTVEIIYKPNFTGSVDEDVIDIVPHSTAFEILDCFFNRSGYTFTKWTTAANGTGTSYLPEEEAPGRSTTLILYAQWELTKVGITFNGNGGTPAVQIKDFVPDEAFNSTNNNSAFAGLTTPSKGAGWRFEGWYTQDGTSGWGTKVTSATTVPDTATTYYARYEYQVDFNAHGGSTETAIWLIEGATSYGTLPTPTRANFSFKGWYTSATGGTLVTSAGAPSTQGPHTLHAQWEFTVTFNAGTGGSVTPTTNKLDDGATTYGSGFLPTPTNSDSTKVFDGWYTADGTGDDWGTKVINTSAPAVNGNHTLYARWETVIPPIGPASKDAEHANYIAGETMDYTISFDLPNDISGYGSIRIEDVFPSTLTYDSIASATIGGVPITPAVNTATAGKVSVTLTAAQLAGNGGETIEIVLTFNVSSTATGIIMNTVNVYVTPIGKTEPTTPDETTTETVVEHGETREAVTYKVEYYYDGVLDTSKTYTGAGFVGDIILNYPDKVQPGYKFDRVEGLPLTLSSPLTRAENVIRVYYVKSGTPATGDNSNAWLWSIPMLLSVAIIPIIRRRKFTTE